MIKFWVAIVENHMENGQWPPVTFSSDTATPHMPSPLCLDLLQQSPCLLTPAIDRVVQEVEEEMKGGGRITGACENVAFRNDSILYNTTNVQFYEFYIDQ